MAAASGRSLLTARSRPFLTEIDGAPLPPTNFAIEDECHRTWISVSTGDTRGNSHGDPT